MSRVKLIEEIKNTQKAISINNKILNEFASMTSINFRIACMVYVVLLAGSFLYGVFTFNYRFIAGTIILLFLFITAIIFFCEILLRIAEYRVGKTLDGNKKILIDKYRGFSECELIELKNKQIKKLIMLAINDYELFHFILFKIDDEKLKEELFHHIYDNTETLDEVCSNPELLLMINELPINNKTENLISQVQKRLEKEQEEENKKEQKRKIFEKAINNKKENKVKQKIIII